MRANADGDLPLPLGDRSGQRRGSLVGVRGAAMKITEEFMGTRIVTNCDCLDCKAMRDTEARARLAPLPSTAPKLTHGQLAHEIAVLRDVQRITGLSTATQIETVIKAWERGQ